MRQTAVIYSLHAWSSRVRLLGNSFRFLANDKTDTIIRLEWEAAETMCCTYILNTQNTIPVTRIHVKLKQGQHCTGSGPAQDLARRHFGAGPGPQICKDMK